MSLATGAYFGSIWSVTVVALSRLSSAFCDTLPTVTPAIRTSACWASVVASGKFAGKRSTPWGPGTTHDYMHAKVTVADDVVFFGSFNLSHSGEQNAENVLEIHDRALADRMAAFIDSIRARYPVIGPADLQGAPGQPRLRSVPPPADA